MLSFAKILVSSLLSVFLATTSQCTYGPTKNKKPAIHAISHSKKKHKKKTSKIPTPTPAPTPRGTQFDAFDSTSLYIERWTPNPHQPAQTPVPAPTPTPVAKKQVF